MNSRKTLVLGASANHDRYSYMAVNRLRNYGHPVVAIGKRPGKVADVDIESDRPDWQDIDTVTLYLNAKNQKQYYDYILSLKPTRIIFNPGAENPELAQLAEENGITPVNACTLVMLSVGNY